MDYFQEARMELDEKMRLSWYRTVVLEKIVQPSIPRYGLMRSERCSSQCSHRYKLRTDPEYAVSQGLPADFATPIALLGVRCHSRSNSKDYDIEVNLVTLTFNF
jgi:hypothetical protein